jgi:hypothetical protein
MIDYTHKVNNLVALNKKNRSNFSTINYLDRLFIVGFLKL